MGKRSPVLGYNHNFKHRGLIFHVQTEDSGVDNPHLFTHLFHGGVIISSRKMDYDNASEVDTVKALMQSQHKAVLKDLKIGTFDDKIDSYLGNREDLEPRKTPAPEVGGDARVVAEMVGDTIEMDSRSMLRPEDDILEAQPISLTDTVSGSETDTMESKPVSRTDTASRFEAETKETKPVGLTDTRGTAATQPVEEAAAAAVAASPEDFAAESLDGVAAEAVAAAARARELAAQAAAEAAHARELQEAAAAATARARELEAAAASVQTHSQSHGDSAHSGAISLNPSRSPHAAPDSGLRAGSVSGPAINLDISDSSRRRRHLPTAVEIPAYSEEGLGDPTVTFSSAPSSSAPKEAIPTSISGERSGTYSMKRPTGNSTQRIGRRRPSSLPGAPDPARPSAPDPARPSAPDPARPSAPDLARPSAQRPAGKAANPVPGRPRSSSVVVSRPAVIIGAPPKLVGKSRKPAPRKARSGGVFGKDLISEKSLDEVIMAYLSEDGSDE